MTHKDRLQLWYITNTHVKKLKIIEGVKVGSVFTLGMFASMGLDPVFIFPTTIYLFWKGCDEPHDQRFYNNVKNRIKSTLYDKNT